MLNLRIFRPIFFKLKRFYSLSNIYIFFISDKMKTIELNFGKNNEELSLDRNYIFNKQLLINK